MAYEKNCFRCCLFRSKQTQPPVNHKSQRYDTSMLIMLGCKVNNRHHNILISISEIERRVEQEEGMKPTEWINCKSSYLLTNIIKPKSSVENRGMFL